jgi:hypothetical protein
MVGEVAGGAPGAGAGNEGLHERTLSLHGVVEVVGRPLMLDAVHRLLVKRHVATNM